MDAFQNQSSSSFGTVYRPESYFTTTAAVSSLVRVMKLLAEYLQTQIELKIVGCEALDVI